MYKYFPHTEANIKGMLEHIGIKSIDELYAEVPEQVRLKKTTTCLKPRANSR